MIIVGLPYTIPRVVEHDRRWGALWREPCRGQRTDGSLTADERTLANALGRRLADVAARLEQKP